MIFLSGCFCSATRTQVTAYCCKGVIISLHSAGGGSGHEPFAAGLVGPGLLAAAAAGDVFASPPAEAVLAAIHAVAGDAGCLLLVANYTGARLFWRLSWLLQSCFL